MNMKAIVYTEYGSPDVLHMGEVAKPIPKENDVLVKVHATTVSYGSLAARTFGKMPPHEFNMPFLFWFGARIAFGWNKPKNPILGIEFSGVIESIGAAVTTFKPGDAVFGYRGQGMGCFAEYVTMPADGLIAHKPDTISHAEAATIPYGALTALTLLRRLNIQPGQKVLIHGASGAIGSFMVQIAKSMGAEVTGTCGTGRMAYVRALGADRVIDYSREDFTRSSQQYDLIIDVLGRSTFNACKRVLTPKGIYFPVSFKFTQIRQMLWTSRFGSKKVVIGLSDEKPADMQTIKGMIEAGTLKGFVDRCFPLEQAVEAHRYYESGQRSGNVILTVA
jgi:NADPH:quinone reductase-like Zn-dependent oxidoreductase